MATGVTQMAYLDHAISTLSAPDRAANTQGVLLPHLGGDPIDPAVFGYIRVSQAEGESGLATQRRTLNDHGLRDDRIFTDVASGKKMRRPSWLELRGMLNRGTRWWSRGLTAWRGTSPRV